MKIMHWVSLSLASLIFAGSVGFIASGPVVGEITSVITNPAASRTMTLMAQAQNAKRPIVVKSGTFKSGEHPTQGKARIVTQNGKSFLELDQGFKTSNLGPDLVVVLHRSNNVLGATQPPAYPLKEGDYVVLAPLQRFNGAQRYAIPNTLNLANFRSAVIWCRQFNATFGAAPLS